MLVIDLHDSGLESELAQRLLDFQAFININPPFPSLLRLSHEGNLLIAIEEWGDQPSWNHRLVHDSQDAIDLLIRLLQVACAAQKQCFTLDAFFPANVARFGNRWRVGSLSSLAYMVAQHVETEPPQAPDPMRAIAAMLVQVSSEQPVSINNGFRLQQRHLPFADVGLFAVVEGLISGAHPDPQAVLDQLIPTPRSLEPGTQQAVRKQSRIEQISSSPRRDTGGSATMPQQPSEVVPAMHLPLPPPTTVGPVIQPPQSVAIQTDLFSEKTDQKTDSPPHKNAVPNTAVPVKHAILSSVVRELKTNFGSNWDYFSQSPRFTGMQLLSGSTLGAPPHLKSDNASNSLYLSCEIDDYFSSFRLLIPNYGLSFFERFIKHVCLNRCSPHASVYEYRQASSSGNVYSLIKPAILKKSTDSSFTIESKGVISIYTG
jgi:hypothetical protein